MLELKILSANVLLPLGIMVAVWLLVRLGPFRPKQSTHQGDEPAASDQANVSEQASAARCVSAASIVLVAGCLAFVAAFLVRVEVARVIWPEDAWARIPHAVVVVSLAGLVAIWVPIRLAAWVLRVVGLYFAARMIIPTGEGWDDVAEQATVWLAVIVGGTCVAWALVDRLPRRWPAVLGLSWIPCVVAAAFLSQDFLRVTEPLLAVATVLGMASLMCLFQSNSQIVATVSGPCLFALSASVANAQFNSFLGLPNSLSWLAILSPGIAALTTLTVPSTEGHSHHSLVRWKVAVIIVACLAMAVAVITWTSLAGGIGGEEEW